MVLTTGRAASHGAAGHASASCHGQVTQSGVGSGCRRARAGPAASERAAASLLGVWDPRHGATAAHWQLPAASPPGPAPGATVAAAAAVTVTATVTFELEGPHGTEGCQRRKSDKATAASKVVSRPSGVYLGP